jgi:hypothetical protein
VDADGRRTPIVVEGQEEGHEECRSRPLAGAQWRSSQRETGSRSSCFHCEDRGEQGEWARRMGGVDCWGRFGGWWGWDSCPVSEEAVSVLYSYGADGQRGG